MKKIYFGIAAFIISSVGWTQTPPNSVDTLTQEEQAVVAALLAKNAETEKQQELPAAATAPAAESQKNAPETEPEDAPEQDGSAQEPKTCLTVAFVDIDVAFNEHPRTVAVKEQIRLKILSKEEEVQRAKQLIESLAQENAQLAAQLRELKPYYERIVVEPHPLLPKIEEPADTLLLGNLLNRLTFSRTEILSASPLDTPARLEDITSRIASNKKIIEERNFFIDNYKYATREEILTLEKKEVAEILQDIYTEIKSFAKKRNIGAVVRKDEILYGEKPVNVTKDFVNRLKKSKKYRKRGK
ncbi:MAG: hypothetical protein IKO35_06785 [Elusimicrobiaceae bacterium]|nr:hypothetical protein [Elusimicrobiaceae bacterium]